MAPRLWVSMLALVGLGCGTDSRQEWTRVEFDHVQVVSTLGLDRPHRALSARLASLKPGLRFELPDSLRPRFLLSAVAKLDAIGPPYCMVAMADTDDRAVHVFRLDGEHLWSMFGNGRGDTPDLSYVTSLAWRPDASLLTVTLPTGYALHLDREGALQNSVWFESPGPPDRAHRRVSWANSTLLVDHWFGLTPPQFVSSTYLAAGDPLLVVRDLDGNVLRDRGEVRNYPGLSLTTALNRGMVAQGRRNTIWFLHTANARALEFEVESDTRGPISEVQLPVFFDAAPPAEFHNEEGNVASYVMNHVRDFDVDPDGRFWVLQNASWTAPGSGQFRPKETVLALYSEGGDLLEVWRMDGVRAIEVAGETLVYRQDAGTGVDVYSTRLPTAARAACLDSPP